MSKEKRIHLFFYILSILSFTTSAVLLCARFSPNITTAVMGIIQHYRPDITIEKISKLHSFIDCNIALFFIYAVSFILFTRIKFSNSDQNAFKFFYPLRNLPANKFNLILLALFVAICAVRIYWITQKKSFHMDELYGISIFHYNEYGLWSGKNFEKLTPFTGKQIKDLILFDDGSVKDTIKDLAHLWIYNRDTAYNNLFLVLSRIWYTGFESSDFKAIFFRESLLNLVFFAFSFYFFILLLNEVCDNKVAKCLVLAIAFLNPATIGLSVFMRSYALQETLLILFSYLFILYIKNVRDKKNINTRLNFIATIVVLFLVINCDYFSFFYVLLLGLFLIIFLIAKKDFSLLYSLVCALLAALIISKVFYLNYGVGFFVGRGSEALSTISSSANKMKNALVAVYNLISYNYLNLFVFLIYGVLHFACLFVAQKNNFGNADLRAALFFGALAWCVLVMFFSPYYTLRYVASIFPLLAVVFAHDKSKNKVLELFFAMTLVFVAILVVKNVIPMKANNQKIEHLDDTDGRIFSAEFIKDPTSDVYIDRNSLYTEILPYLNDKQVYYFVDSVDELKSYGIKGKRYYYVKYDDDKPHDFTVIKFEGND